MRFVKVIKPGIVFGNLVTVLGGFFLGTHGTIDGSTLVMTLLGMGLVMGSGCVLNNLIDRDIDRLMERTRNRPLATGQISPVGALTYAALLGIAGLILLYKEVNGIAGSLALIGLFLYVGLYTLHFKRLSVNGTLVGALSGAIPPVVGYAAATGRLDGAAFVLFVLLVIWQMPHFYAIGLYRLADFRAAGLPILPVVKGIAVTKRWMVVYVALFALVALLPTLLGYAGWIYFVGALLVGLAWLTLAVSGLFVHREQLWARLMFIASVIAITLLSFLMLDST